MSGCYSNTDDYVIGTEGTAQLLKFRIEGKNPWKFDKKKDSMYDVEHRELFAGLRSGNHINNGDYMSYSTLMAIMGREACYTGQTLTSDQVLNSETRLGPTEYEWGAGVAEKVATPGVTKLV